MHQADWDAKSVASTDILSRYDYASSAPNYEEAYQHYPIPLTDSPSLAPASLPMDNPSTDQLLPTHERSEQFTTGPPPRSQPSRAYHHDYSPMPPGARHAAHMSDVDLSDPSSPLLAQDPWSNNSYASGGGGENNGNNARVPYPPSAYTQPPLGYVPPTMRRTASDLSESDVGGAGVSGATGASGATRWDSGDREERDYLSGQGSQGYYRREY